MPFLASALIAPSLLTVVAVVATHSVAEAFSRRGALKAAFNIAQTSFATSMGILVFLALGGIPLQRHAQSSLLSLTTATIAPFLALVAVFFVVNTFAVSGVIAASSGRKVLSVWKESTSSTLIYDVLSAPVVFLFAWVYVRTGVIGALGLALPLLGARQLYKTNRQLEQLTQELLQLMVKAIEARDPYTSGHSRRVAHYSRIIARAVGMNSKTINRVGVAALLHDVGKIHEVYAPILRKPGRLTPDEWAIMKTHPVKSAELVTMVSDLRNLVGAIRHHHENWDGSGYPDQIAGETIPIESRIIMFADTIDAMTSDRPYRKALGEEDVRKELAKYRGSQFDPEICDRLLASTMFGLLFQSVDMDALPGGNKALTPRSLMVVGA
ncbi:MAG: HD-GYP domain-containing protein [Thermoleophilaceae bacterium]|nr:HD-GYP domain-containing protein [Thermoleophilaceae bacterium]